ncbi:hypothetical protein LIER_10958 [Lithospermum erythrorhizon]|uniref:Integrase catalytic domain-containing protein n=1 Tax=Lithospermum erythrorhizon TaxID=34254 RepID=A0AAV3PNB0_LITER
MSMLWHKRYGHLSFKGINTLQSKDMVRGMPMFKEQEVVFTDCLNGRQTGSAIPKHSNSRASKILELIHSDIYGPINPTSSRRKKYFLCLIDYHKRKGWIYMLANKSETFECFKTFKDKVEKESGEQIRGLITDRGGEYTSGEFNEYCKYHGIKRQLTNAYTPQQHGVTERRNRAIMNMVRSLLFYKKMPKYFWIEAVVWTVYLLNKYPSLSIKDTTPEEA